MKSTTVRNERPHSINGVSGRLYNVVVWPWPDGLIANQRWVSDRRPTQSEGPTLQVEIRLDDSCKNGALSFAVTGTERGKLGGIVCCGCLHDDIAKWFPELAPLLKWHLFDTRGPMHYIANTVYHAGNRDHNGLLAGEQRQIVDGKTEEPCWQLVTRDHLFDEVKGPKYMDAHDEPTTTFTTKWEPWCLTGAGKARDLSAARSTAVWPEATDAELSVSKADLTAALTARLPDLVADFLATMTACGFLLEVPGDSDEA